MNSLQLVSRSGTLFSIIDGKEVICKDQEQAKKIIPPVNDMIYSVPGYTVRVEEIRYGLKPIGYTSVAILSLEAPEKDIVGGQLNIPEDKNKTDTYVVGPEQPAQPVDNRENTVLADLRNKLTPYFNLVAIIKDGSSSNQIRDYADHCDNLKVKEILSRVSTSPERGEDDQLKSRIKELEEENKQLNICLSSIRKTNNYLWKKNK